LFDICAQSLQQRVLRPVVRGEVMLKVIHASHANGDRIGGPTGARLALPRGSRNPRSQP
jgi:hypothetical protein